MATGRMQMDPALQPTALELAVSTLFGYDRALPPLPRSGDTPRQVLERLLRDALVADRPCVILFSGGRDSSTLLAIATHVARRDGLDEPIALTHRYPGHTYADEADWQSAVIEHLGLRDWEVVERTFEHEALGEVALGQLRRHGVRNVGPWWVPSLPQELGGVALGSALPAADLRANLVVGTGGDEIFGSPVRPLRARLLAGRVPGPRALRRGWGQLLPTRTWLARDSRWWAQSMPWVRPAAAAEAGAALALDRAALPDRYDRLLDALWRVRDVRGLVDATTVAAADSGAQLRSPFVDPRFLGALAQARGRSYPSSRAAALGELVGDLLPARVLNRASKGDYTSAFLGEQTIEWLEGWDGSGTADELVDGLVAREVLLEAARNGPRGDARALGVAQQAMLTLTPT